MDNGNVNTGKDVVSSVDITESRFALWVGETKQLHVTVSPSNVTNGSIRWSSGNSAVITVDENTGLVTAVGEGTTTLMASSIMDNTKTDTISVTVAPSSTVCVLDSTNPNTGYTNTLTVNSVSYLTGDKYRCKPWTTKPENQEEEYFNFYVLDANDSTDTISLLMDRNISGLETVDWSDATEYINGLEVTTCSGNNIRFAVTKWNRVDGVSLPTGLQIANAGKITGWTQVDTWSYFGSSTVNTVNTNRTNFAWLCDYTNFCKKRGKCNYQTTGGVYGYWTSTGYQTDSSPSAAWIVNDDGRLTYYDVSFTDYIGVRPVITLSSSKLSQ